MGNALKYWRPKYRLGKLNTEENQGRPKETPLAEPLAKRLSSDGSSQLPPCYPLPPELNPSRYDAFMKESSRIIKKFFLRMLWKDTYRIEKITRPVQIGNHTSMEFHPTDSSGGYMAEVSKPVYQEEVISTNRIPIRRLRLPFRLAGAALLIGTLGWGVGYCMGFPPPQRLLIESQRQELYRNMELEECWRGQYSREFIFSESLDMLSKVRCAERKYSENH